MKISVIIPVYNVEKYIEQCLKSILDQNYKNLEIILVNDGTKDNSMKIIEKYLLNSRIKVINKKNGGLSSARNAGLEVATGDYISFVDSDDYLAKNLYENISKHIEDEDIILFDYLSIDKIENFERLRKRKEKIVKKNTILIDEEKEEFFKKTSWSCWAKIYKRDFIEKNDFKFIEGIIYEDINWEIETIFHAKKIKYIPFVGYYYRRLRKDSIMNSRKEEVHKKSCRIIKNRIEEFIKRNSDKLSNGFLGSLSLVIEKMKCEYGDKNIDILSSNKKFYSCVLDKSISKTVKINILNDYINLLNSFYSYKRNSKTLFRIYFFKIVRKIVMKIF